MNFPPDRTNARSSTRIPTNIQATLTSLDPDHPISDTCLIILVSPQGCTARFHHSLKVGTEVRLLGLPTSRTVTAQVMNCIPIDSERFWVLGLALDEPANVWGIELPPADWKC